VLGRSGRGERSPPRRVCAGERLVECPGSVAQLFAATGGKSAARLIDRVAAATVCVGVEPVKVVLTAAPGGERHHDGLVVDLTWIRRRRFRSHATPWAAAASIPPLSSCGVELPKVQSFTEIRPRSDIKQHQGGDPTAASMLPAQEHGCVGRELLLLQGAALGPD
jgi:hypothetical protein